MANKIFIDHILFMGRTYEEILQVFALEEEDIRDKRVLDCNSGPDAFVGEANRRGFTVTGCDPLYTKPVEEILDIGRRDTEHFLERAHGNEASAGKLDVEAFAQDKLKAMDQFAKDFAAGHHIAGALPELPFEDDAFDLALSGHFLFLATSPSLGGMVNTETFDLAFHRRAVRDLLRVSREVRLFPCCRIGEPSVLHPYAARLIGELASDGHQIGLLENVYDQGSFTDHHVLTIKRA
ncbi:MAG: hypothetical protein AAGF10_02805 [Verrucomicrobiota bacterium]